MFTPVRRADGSRAGKNTHAIAADIIITGTGAENTHCHATVSTMIPPRVGPMVGPSTMPMPNHPIAGPRSEEHTSELQSLMRISYAVFCLKKKTKNNQITQ